MPAAMVTVQGLDEFGQPVRVGAGAIASFAASTVSLPANASTKIASAGDRLFAVINTGTGNVNLGFGGPAFVDQGFPCDAAIAAGRQGGGPMFDSPVTITADIFAISAAGSAMVVLKG